MALDRLTQVTNSGITTTISFSSNGINVSGAVTASSFVGDGSGLTGVVGSGSGVVVLDGGSTVGTAATINFGTNLSVSAISGGIVTVTVSSSGLSNIVEDTTPQLGGNLDLNSKNITGTGNVNITGVITATSFSGTVPSSSLSGALPALDGSALTGITAAGSGVVVQDEGSSVGTAATINFVGSGVTATFSGGVATVTVSSSGGAGISDGDKGDITVSNSGATWTIDDDTIGLNELSATGTPSASNYLRGDNSWATITTGITDVVSDTTPQLGGNLDLNSNNVSGTGDFNVTGIITATTLSATSINGGTFSGNATLSGLLTEGVNITAGKLSDNTNIDLANGMVHLFTTTETTTCTPNIRFNAFISLDSSMNTGDAVTVALITTAATAGYSAQLTIDGGTVTEEWLGGSAPSTGGSGGYDVYTYNIIKTGSATFVVLANLVNFA